MPKRVALKDSIEVDSVDLSNFARSVEFSSEHERIDVSGFNATGANEYLAGQTEQEVTVEFFGGYAAAETYATLWPIHSGREVVAFAWRPDQTQPVSATNPSLEGNVQLLTYNPSATRGEEEAWEATFVAADADGLAYVTSAENMARETVAVHGLKEFLKACTQAEPNVRKEVRETFREVGDIIRHDATRRFSPINSASAGGFRTRVRQKGIAVQQSKRKTTGKHPEYGSLQMRAALLPALQANETDMNRQLERAMDRVAKRFERHP